MPTISIGYNNAKTLRTEFDLRPFGMVDMSRVSDIEMDYSTGKFRVGFIKEYAELNVQVYDKLFDTYEEAVEAEVKIFREYLRRSII